MDKKKSAHIQRLFLYIALGIIFNQRLDLTVNNRLGLDFDDILGFLTNRRLNHGLWPFVYIGGVGLLMSLRNFCINSRKHSGIYFHRKGFFFRL